MKAESFPRKWNSCVCRCRKSLLKVSVKGEIERAIGWVSEKVWQNGR